MNYREIMKIIPRPARIGSAIVLGSCAVIGPVVGYIEQMIGNGWVPFHGLPLPILGAMIGFGMGVFIGSIFAGLVLSYGYVYGDARRRAMPEVLWTLVVILIPNLLGFLLYFILRKPLASPCPQCGQGITPEQRFCAWCGYQRPAGPPTAVSLS